MLDIWGNKKLKCKSMLDILQFHSMLPAFDRIAVIAIESGNNHRADL